MTYARWWRGCWSLIAATGLGVAILQMSSAALFAVALLAATAAAVILVARASKEWQPAAGRADTPAVGTRALGWGAVVLAIFTVIGDSPPGALLLALVAATTCPPVVRLCRAVIRPDPVRRSDADPEGDEATATPEAPLLDDTARMVRRLSEADLCELWRSTFWELHEQHTGDERLTLVTLRQTCLDELGRRNPEGLQAWLASGARASSSPDRFLHPPDHGSHDAA